MTRYELRDVATGPSGPGDFQPDMRVVEELDEEAPPGPVNLAGLVARQAAKEARSAVRSFLGVMRGGDTQEALVASVSVIDGLEQLVAG